MIKGQMAETREYVVYELNGVTYVPHYKEKFYVGPGYTIYAGFNDNAGNRYYTVDSDCTYTASFLESKGAKKTSASLWHRAEFKPLR